MSTNATDVPSVLQKEIIQAFSHAIKPPITFIMLGTIFSSMLLPLLTALFYYSTPQGRRRPIFILNACSLVLGILLGVINAHLQITLVLSPSEGVNYFEDFAWNVIWEWTPWLAETILILRLLAVLQPPTPTQLIRNLAFPIVIKILRAVLIIMYLRRWHEIAGGRGPIDPDELLKLVKSWFVKLALLAQLADDSYISGIFLYHLHMQGRVFRSTSVEGSLTVLGWHDTLRNKLKTLFWLAAANFVFPVALDICAIVVVFTASNYLLASYINIVNVYLCIICTVLATVWSQSVLHHVNVKTTRRTTSRFAPRFAPFDFSNETFRLETRSKNPTPDATRESTDLGV